MEAADDDAVVRDAVERALEPYVPLLPAEMLEVFRQELTLALRTHPACAELLERVRAGAGATVPAEETPPPTAEDSGPSPTEAPQVPAVTRLDEQQRRGLVKAGMAIVERLAKRVALRHGTLDRDELVSLGHIGLMEALLRHDPALGAFEAFARQRIQGAMMDGLRREIPHARALASAHFAGGEYLQGPHSEGNPMEDSDEEQRQQLEDFSDGLLASMAMGFSVRAARGAEEAVAARQLLTRLDAARAALPDPEKAVLDLRYEDEHDMKEVAGRLRITYIMARRRHVKTMQTLARELRAQGITRPVP